MFLVLMDKCIGQQPYHVLFRFPRYFEFQIVIGLASWYTPCVIQLVLYFNNVFYIFKKKQQQQLLWVYLSVRSLNLQA